MVGRRLMVTAKGYFGLASCLAQQGDHICILYGCSRPVILRPNADSATYTFIGDSYVHGVMEGEAMKWREEGRYRLGDFTIT